MIGFSAGIMWYFNKHNDIPNHVWMASMALTGFIFSWTFFANSIKSNPSVLAAIVGFLCIIGIYYLSMQIKVMINIPYTSSERLLKY